MTIYMACGWEAGHKDVWNPTISGDVTAEVAGVHTGIYGIDFDPDDSATFAWQYASYVISGSPTSIYLAAWIKYDSTSHSQPRIGIILGDGKELYIDVTSSVCHAIVDGVTVATGAAAFGAGAWHHLQVYFNIADAGAITTRVDGNPDIAYSGDTKPAASAVIASVKIGGYNRSWLGPHYHTYMDDFIAMTSWPGDVRIDPLYTSAAGDSTQMTPSAGANWDCVKEVPPNDDTDYVTATGYTDKDLYNLGDWTGTAKSPLAVVQYTRAEKLTGDTIYLQQLLKSGVTEDAGASQTLILNTYKYYQRLKETAPGGGAWSDANIDSLQAGQQTSAT